MQVHKVGSKKFYNMKLVYTGAPEVGKTTNVRELAKKWAIDTGFLTKEGERTVFFDHISKKVFTKGKNLLKVSVYSVPGQETYRQIREQVLSDADAVVFVIDLRPEKLEENVEAFHDLEDILLKHCCNSMRNYPLVIQYNKHDLVGHIPVDITSFLNEKLGIQFPFFTSSASLGIGVLETFVDAVNNFLDSSEVGFRINNLDLRER